MTEVVTKVQKLRIYRPNKTQFESVSPDPYAVYAVDPEFTGGKLLATDSDGDIVETGVDPSNVVSDVQVNGTTVVTSGVANIPKANNDGTVTGVVQLSNTYGSQTVSGYLAAVDRSYNGFVGATSTSFASVGGVKAYVGGTSVLYSASQSLTGAQKTQARENIGAEGTSDIITLDATDSITLDDNTIYNGGTQTALTITLWTNPTASSLCQIVFSSGSTATTLSYSNTIKWRGDDIYNNLFVPATGKRYTVVLYYDGSETVGIVTGV